MYRIQYSKVLPLLALVICASRLNGATLVASPAALPLSCDTVLGPIPATVNLTLAAAGAAVTVTPTVPGGSPLATLPAAASVSSTSVAVPFVFSVAAGCKGATTGQTVVITLTPSSGTALTVTATITVTNSATALATSPAAVTLTCAKNGNSYSAGPAQTVNVTSPANSGTPFTVTNTSPYALPSWMTVSPLGGGTASATPVALTITPVCAGLAVGSTTFNVHLANAPAPDKILPVTMQVGSTATLTPSPTSITLTYTKGSLNYVAATDSLSASPAVFFSVDPSSLPIWLNVATGGGATTGTTTNPVVMNFTPTAGAETLAVGSYTANVRFKVSGALDTVVPVTLKVSNPSATLSVSEGTTRTLNWTLGNALPTLIITPVSSDSPIPYTVSTTAGTLSPQVPIPGGLAYNFGTPLTITFLQSVFGGAAPGTTLTGHVIFTPASGSPVDVTINVKVLSPGANITSLAPSALPTATSGSFTVVLTGSGFVPSTDATIRTKVGIVSGGLIVSDFNMTSTVQNTNSIIVTINVPGSADPYLPFSTGGPVVIGVCNPQGVGCSTASSNQTVNIGVNPIISAVTSASSFLQAPAPALTPIAPYDILTIFGSNFCVSGGTGCLSPSPILYGSTDPVTVKYPTSLSPDASGATQRVLTVSFLAHGSSTVIGTAPLLFASNNQINLIAPDALTAYIGNTVDIQVSFGYGTGTNLLKSAVYSVTVAATDPGVFTVGGDGQGGAAAILSGILVDSSNPAGARSTNAGGDSDIISLFVTGLGKPDSDNSAGTWSASCMAPATYFGLVNTATTPTPVLTSDDGLVVQSALFPASTIQPCLKSTSANVPTVNIGGVAGVVKYAGWVADSVAGLYQINVQLPVSSAAFVNAAGNSVTLAGTAVTLPLTLTTASGGAAQGTGVTLSVIRRLTMTAVPSGLTVNATHNVALGGSAVSVTASGGTSSYTYAVTTGTLPAGLTLNADGTITGTPTTPGNSTVTITATDSTGGTALTGTVTFTFVVV